MLSNLQKSSMSCTNIINQLENKPISDIDPEQLVLELRAIQESIDEANKLYEEEN